MSHPPPGEPDQPPSPYEPPSYGQPPHHDPYGQQPQWGQQPPYAPQPPYGQYGPPGEGPRPRGGPNVLAILSLVFAFVFAPAGIVLGHLAKRQIRQTGEEGDQLATWGLILSYVFTAIGLLACCGWIAVAFWANSDGGGSYN
ncbi:uncharacterized protein DUF4190 [Micromonospora kangleipakensis]|uniref:Uncharacterized protein DUF4190 n=1 Tax=Micromonospora kangleipakensis TaxID=1077942 RepID=A0A4Q8B648_9ACTN|nr:DUF4190 domain-containing protein [Micromonospora kangleipakensis]RZU73100.1 uncharacterized protein DUF4190 [Micromonospora kangleipakensis]